MLTDNVPDPQRPTRATQPNYNGASALRRDIEWLDKCIRDAQRLETVVATISPEFADHILKNHNRNNRPLKPAKIAEYVASIKQGKWRLVAQGMSFATDGRLNNGQNRLTAIVQAGIAVKLLVAFGEETDVFDVIDTGKVRGGDDVLAIAGFQNTTTLAAAARMLYSVDAGYLSTAFQMSNEEMLEYVLKLGPPGENALADIVAEAQTVAKKLKCPPTPIVVASHLIRRGKTHLGDPLKATNKAKVDAYFSALGSGAGLMQRSPILYLRDAIKEASIGGDLRSHYAKSVRLCGLVVITWNMKTQGKKGKPEWDGKGSFPVAE